MKKINIVLITCFVIINQLIAQDKVSGELVQWQRVSLSFTGPETSETAPVNPFMDCKLEVKFTNESETLVVQGFYAADGNAAETSATKGNVWIVHFTPPTSGEWNYEVYFKKGNHIAIEDDAYMGEPIAPHHGKKGNLTIKAANKNAKRFEKSGRLTYKNSRYLHTSDGKPLLKFGPNSPENFLAFADIDGTYSYDSVKSFLKTWAPHQKDWKKGDPTWQNGKGKGIIGALNYIASKGMNCVYALTMNIGGDARDVWPFISHQRKDFLRYDVSKLAQWDIIFSHAEKLGIIMHLITQETENELLLDDGYTIKERKLYYRELIARFAHHKNIIWNMGEENSPPPWEPQGQNDQQRLSMIRYLKDNDPYKNPLVIHTLPAEAMREPILNALIGYSKLDGVSMQIANVYEIHHDIKKWVAKSSDKHRPWIVSMDEIGPWHTGANADIDDPKHDTIRQEVLWSTLMAGGAGVEWYFGWLKPPHDLNAEDWRSRNNVWEQTAIAHEFFKQIPFAEMKSSDELTSDSTNYCFSKANEVYAIYLKKGGTAKLNLTNTTGKFDIKWFDPRKGGKFQNGTIKEINGGDWVEIGAAPENKDMDWAVLIKKVQ